MKIRVKYFGSVKDEAGVEQEEIELDPGSKVSSVVDKVKDIHTPIAKRESQILFALNQNYCTPDSEVKDGDELALFPIVSGG